MEGITAVTVTAIIGVLIWYLKYQTRRQAEREDKQDTERLKAQEKRDKEQKEERDYYRGIITNEMSENTKLNLQGIALTERIMKDFEKHDGHSEKFSKKIVQSLGIICKKMNSSGIIRGIIDRRRKNVKVGVNRRK